MTPSLEGLRIAGFPGRYLQGPGALDALSTVVRDLGGRHVLAVTDDTVEQAIGSGVRERLRAEGLQCDRLRFDGECTALAIGRLATLAQKIGGDVVLALGGGKAIDTAKGVAKATAARLVVAPTIASNDSATSRLIVIYDDAHSVVAVDFLARNPDVVLVDTREIVRAPVRYFRAGIGDALSKTFEAAQCRRAGGKNFFGGRPPETAGFLADRCYQVIREHGPSAVQDVLRHEGSLAVEAVTEATVLLSGLGFESGGLSIAHAMIRGLTGVPTLAAALHGEMVAFGTVVQLVLEQRPDADVREHLALLARLGMSATLGALGAAQLRDEELATIATLTLAAPYAVQFEHRVGFDALRRAVLEADRLGREFQGGTTSCELGGAVMPS